MLAKFIIGAVFVALCSASEEKKPFLPVDQQKVLVVDVNTTQDGWTLYKQCDSAWGSQELGTCSDTICSAGCAMSSVAMILSTKANPSTNPSQLNSWLKSNGGYASGCLIIWSSVNAFGTVTYIGQENPTEAEICSGLSAGHGLVANVRGGSHWVLLTGCNGGGVYRVNDPGFNSTTYQHSDILVVSVYH